MFQSHTMLPACRLRKLCLTAHSVLPSHNRNSESTRLRQSVSSLSRSLHGRSVHGRDCEKRALCLPSSLHGEHYTNFQWVMATGEKKKENYPRASHYTPTAVLDRVEYNNMRVGPGPFLEAPVHDSTRYIFPFQNLHSTCASRRSIDRSIGEQVVKKQAFGQHCHHQCCVSRRRNEQSKPTRVGASSGDRVRS